MPRRSVIEVATVRCPSVAAPDLDEESALELSRSFAALGDPVRINVLNTLAQAPDGEVCICNLVEPLGKSQPTLSHHMKVLSEAGLVRGERRGRWVWYSFDRDRLAGLRAALEA